MKSILIAALMALSISAYGSVKTVIIDADTANEVDDLYAIVAALIAPELKVSALNATHWQTSHWATANSMEDSHRLNQVLLGYMNMNIPSKRGGLARMFDWGDQAQHSAAAYEIIKQAHALAEGEKLHVIALGALTNVASALWIDPSIEAKLKVFWLGTSYDFERGALATQDFNAIMDIQAAHNMLKSTVEMTIIPVNVAAAMRFDFLQTEKRLNGPHPIEAVLVDRWRQHMDGSKSHRVIWDLALIYAIIYPELATFESIRTSPDYGNRRITYIRDIKAQEMRERFFKQLADYLERHPFK